MGAGKRFSAGLQPGGDPSVVLVAALAAVEDFIAEARLDDRDGARLAVVVEELASNALRHGATERWLKLDLALTAELDGVRLTLEDDGVAFDPTADTDFAGPDRLTGGGVGLALVRTWADELAYARIDGRNRLELRVRPA